MREKHLKNKTIKTIALLVGTLTVMAIIAAGLILQNYPTSESPVSSVTPISIAPTNRPLPTPIMLSSAENASGVVILSSPTPIILTATPFMRQIYIVRIDDMGGVNESVVMSNMGSTVNITGYTLSDLEGHVYHFQEQIFFANAEIHLHTGTKQDTPIHRYWGLSTPVWETGDVMTLKTDQGDVVDPYVIGDGGIELTATPGNPEERRVIQYVQDVGEVHESLVMSNPGMTVKITGYSLSDLHGHVYIFPETTFYSKATLVIFTKTGQDTPFARYWGLSVPIWKVGESVILKDSQGNVIDTLIIGGESDS